MSQLSDIVSQIEPQKQPIARSLVTELTFMRGTLAKLRKEVRERGVVEEFKQGKQEFTREQPALKTYNVTVSRYAALYKQLVALLPTGTANAGDELDEFLDE